MPTYSYYCRKCDQKKERLSKIADRDMQRCENCNNYLDRGIDSPGMVWAPTAGGMRT